MLIVISGNGDKNSDADEQYNNSNSDDANKDTHEFINTGHLYSRFIFLFENARIDSFRLASISFKQKYFFLFLSLYLYLYIFIIIVVVVVIAIIIIIMAIIIITILL